MADTNILYDEQGHPRHFNIIEDADTDIAPSATRAMPASAQEAAKQFLASHADLLQLKRNVMQSMDVRASLAPVAEDEALRFESEKHTMDSTVVSYNQTMFGLPIYQAGVSVVMTEPGQGRDLHVALRRGGATPWPLDGEHGRTRYRRERRA
jgi:hypothetical protein